MSIYHCSIKIINRAGGRSAVASAAYRAGEKLYNKETGLVHDFQNKSGVVMNEILLPVNAPKRYLNREVLWNEVQSIEKRSDAQLAREVEVAFPREMSREEQVECVRDYIKENFVSKGMIADWALHDKKKNPHAHIMLTMRGFDERENWVHKQKTVFANTRDENGRAVYDPTLPSYDPKNKMTEIYRIPVLDSNGEQKKRIREGKGCEYLWERISIPANDWNEHCQAELWRKSWAEKCNKYLKKENWIDHRSYERQGLDRDPSIHEGTVSRQIEERGRYSDRCELNRKIKEQNIIREKMKRLIKETVEIIEGKAREILERFEKFRRGIGTVEGSGRDARYFGGTTESVRAKGERESTISRAIRRVREIERTVEFFSEQTEKTDREIARIERLVKDRRDRRDERIRKLKERREASRYAGGYAGAVGDGVCREYEVEKQRIAESRIDIEDFLREFRVKERNSEEKRDDSIFERENREAERKRLNTTRERDSQETERRVTGLRTTDNTKRKDIDKCI